jgi:hypothetical protein
LPAWGPKIEDLRPAHNQTGLKCLIFSESRMAPSHIYKVVFMNQGKVYEIYARGVSHGELFGFVQVEELIFGERSSVVVDPAEERIQSEFSGVRRSYIPLHSVIRIDEVEKQGVSKISSVEGGNVAQFPMPVYTPGDPGPGK